MSDCPSILQLYRLQADYESTPEDNRLKVHLEECSRCREHWQQLLSSSQEYSKLQVQERRRLHERILQSTDHSIKPMRLVWVAGGAAVLVFLIGALVLTMTTHKADKHKGSLSMSIVAKRYDRQFWVKPGEKLNPGDILRFVVTTPTSGWIYVLSIDGNGRLQSFYPDSSANNHPKPLELTTGGKHVLPGGIALDQWIGLEMFFVVFSPEEFSRSTIDADLRNWFSAQGDLESLALRIGEDFMVTSMPIQKVSASP